MPNREPKNEKDNTEMGKAEIPALTDNIQTKIFPRLAFCLSIVGFLGFFTTIPALILAHISISRLPANKKPPKLASVAIILCYIQIGLLVVLFALAAYKRDKFIDFFELGEAATVTKNAVLKNTDIKIQDIVTITGENTRWLSGTPFNADEVVAITLSGPIEQEQRDEVIEEISRARKHSEFRLGRAGRPWVVFDGNELIRFPKLGWTAEVGIPGGLQTLDLDRVIGSDYHVIFEFHAGAKAKFSPIASELWLFPTGDLDRQFQEFKYNYLQGIKDSGSQYSILKDDPITGEYLIEFLTWAEPGKILEYNIVFVSKSTDVKTQIYMLRSDNPGELISAVPTIRALLLEAVNATGRMFEIKTGSD